MNLVSIDLNLLRCLVALVEEGSVSKTSVRLQLSQPAVSHSLKKLRMLFQDPLLVRAGASMCATPRGESLAYDAKSILDSVDNLIHPPKNFEPSTHEGMFTLSAPEYVDFRITPTLSKMIMASAPMSRLMVRPPAPGLAERHMESGELDLRIGWVDKIRPDFRSKLLYTEKIVCIAGKKNESVLRGLDFDRYVTSPHVRSQVSMPSTSSRSIDKVAHTLGLSLKVALIVPSLLTLGKVVSESELIATVPHGVAEFLKANYAIDVFKLPIDVDDIKVAMYWHERMQTDKKHLWFRHMIALAAQPGLQQPSFSV